MLMTTLASIRAAKPCESGYRSVCDHLGGLNKFGAETPFTVATIMDSNNVADTCWTLANVCGEPGWKILGLWAADCAERSLPAFESFMPAVAA